PPMMRKSIATGIETLWRPSWWAFGNVLTHHVGRHPHCRPPGPVEHGRASAVRLTILAWPAGPGNARSGRLRAPLTTEYVASSTPLRYDGRRSVQGTSGVLGCAMPRP